MGRVTGADSRPHPTERRVCMDMGSRPAIRYDLIPHSGNPYLTGRAQCGHQSSRRHDITINWLQFGEPVSFEISNWSLQLVYLGEQLTTWLIGC